MADRCIRDRTYPTVFAPFMISTESNLRSGLISIWGENNAPPITRFFEDARSSDFRCPTPSARRLDKEIIDPSVWWARYCARCLRGRGVQEWSLRLKEIERKR